jgi:replicative DNA helicase
MSGESGNAAVAGSGGVALQRAPVVNEDAMRPLPYALGPEKSILSSMLQNATEFVGAAVEERLTADHFHIPAHGILFSFLTAMCDANESLDLVGIVQRLLDRGLLDRVGGAAAVADLYTYAPNGAHFLKHLEMVKDKYVLRSIIRCSNEAIARAFDAPDEVAELLDNVEQDILSIRGSTEKTVTSTLQLCLNDVIDEFKNRLENGITTSGFTTGYGMLDTMSGGLKAGELFVIAARPSMGKTSLMMNIVEHICIDLGAPAMVFSCEMAARQIVQRLLFSRARFALSKIKRGYRPDKGELQRIARATDEISKCRMLIDDTAGISINELRAKARRRKRDDGIGFLAIDYLQLMRSRSRQAENSREREIAEISSGLKGLAKELDIPVLVLAQLNRGPEGRTGKSLGVPRLSDLRESGSIEQDADLVGLLYRSAYYADSEEDKENEEGKATLVLAKNRNGETGDIPLTFVADLMRFEPGPPAREVEA